ncbi:TPM domain-containing protein [Nocardia goodfellowii]|uniref:Membrane protein YgcG n=1 Tax=Nocardia goodfellowii TaxID=882446 RepID=A0ABS4QQL1_9NOCA|nr:TPM domain-containing protein [Nocardia goodfellowii]MBP2194001.1 putative membrane protein YgcG [Nocardia goodfellowii]
MQLPWSRLARWSASLLVSIVLACVALLSAPVSAAPPGRMGSYVVDDAKALDQAELGRVGGAVEQLYTDRQVRLWINYVPDFSGLGAQSWAERTARESGFGRRDLLLAVATESRDYWFAGDLPEGVSDAELEDLLTREVEPDLHNSQWAEAGIAMADGLDSAMASSDRAGGGRTVLALWGLIVLGVLGFGLYWLFRRRQRNEQRRAQLDAARALDLGNTAALAALPLETLHQLSRDALVDIDNAIRTSAEELEIAAGEFGATAVSPFVNALENAKVAASKAFSIRQQLDDEIPETPDEQRSLLVELLSTIGRADKELDARVTEFDEMRSLLINAPGRLDALTQAIVDLTGRIPASEAELARLAAAHPPEVLTPIRDNVGMARERITFAEHNIDIGRDALAQPVGKQGAAVPAIRSAEAAVGQARVLLDAVDNASVDIEQARAGLPAALAELRKDLDDASGLTTHGGPDLTAAVDAAQQALRKAETSGGTDPLGSFHAAVAADGDLDKAIAAATDRKLAAEDLARRLDQALANARSRVQQAGDYISTRRGGVDANARTRLSEAQRNLDAAQQLSATDPVEALRNARSAADMAGRALHEAQASVQAWESSQSRYSGSYGRGPFGYGGGFGGSGAVLGGILLQDLLRGAAGGRSGGSGGWSAGSYGGSSGSRRISRGGRF